MWVLLILLSAIKAVVSYLARRNSQPGLIFITEKGKGWTSAMFCTALMSLWTDLKLDKQSYNTHKFRIGVATFASIANISDSHILLLGLWKNTAFQRWKNTAFQRYIRYPPKVFQKTLAMGPSDVLKLILIYTTSYIVIYLVLSIHTCTHLRIQVIIMYNFSYPCNHVHF